MAETVRVAVAIATPNGVWVVPGTDEDGEFDPELLEGRADPARDMDDRENVALEIVHTRFSRFVSGFDLQPVADFPTPDARTDETAVFCAFSDVLEPPIDRSLECVDAEELPHVALGARDPAVTIALLYAELHGRRGAPNSPFSPRVGPPARDHSRALLHEQPTPDGALWSATFSCEVTGDGTTLRGPTAATADEAVAWGRAHADAVLLFVGDRVGRPYNAGSELHTDFETGEPWPPVPDLADLVPRPVRPEDVVRYVPLHPTEEPPAEE